MMAPFRLLLIRGSLLLNAGLVLYLCLSWMSLAPTKKVTSRNHGDEYKLSESVNETPYLRHTFSESNLENPDGKGLTDQNPQLTADEANSAAVLDNAYHHIDYPKPEAAIKDTGEREGEYQEPPREVQERAGMTEPPMVVAPLVEEGPDPPLDSVERKIYGDLRECHTGSLGSSASQRGEYWILNNYVPAAMSFRCDESVTYTTHGDYTFLDNLDPLTSRWQGPVSVSVYAPGSDFQVSVDTILYLRNCMAEGVKKYVTFHLFFHVNHIPKQVPTTEQLLQRKSDCVKDPPKWINVTTYRQLKKLVYPVNVARNTARENAQTYFNFPSDVELYPSINFIPEFFKMLKRPDASNSSNQRVYVFPIFEVSENQNAPETKAELQAMLANKKAIPFHKKICQKCHNQPKSSEWQSQKPTPEMSVFYVGKRQRPYDKWEPIYVGTNREPIFDERLSWEGKSDKMTQMYILCVRDYEFHIMSDAFLVHRPGIKEQIRDPDRDKQVAKQNFLIKKKVAPEYRALFGTRKGCVL